MERTERYDPEDLEQLMLERGFDELLAEERAYALRHLAGRAEYERMRALLLHTRELAGRAPLEDAPPEVREHVLAAFRAQQRPQWRIWLNSVGAFLLPARPALYWRPALALGALAVLSTSVWLLRQGPGPGEKKVLAELHTAVPAPAVHEPAPPPAAPEAESSAAEASGNTALAASGRDRVVAAQALEAAQAAAPAPPAPAAPEEAAQAADAFAAEAAAVQQDAPAPKRAAGEMAKATRAERADDARELAFSKAGRESPAPAYGESDLLGLLRAAW